MLHTISPVANDNEKGTIPLRKNIIKYQLQSERSSACRPIEIGVNANSHEVRFSDHAPGKQNLSDAHPLLLPLPQTISND